MITINVEYLKTATKHLSNGAIADRINECFGSRYNNSSISKLHNQKYKNLKLLKFYCDTFGLDINKATLYKSELKKGFD